LLKDEHLQAAQRASVSTIHHAGEHLHSLIDGLLDLARIEAGRLRLDPAPLPMHEFLDDVVRMVAPQAEAKGLTFSLRTSGPVPAYVSADAKRLRQILINLLSNAVRFTDSGSVTLHLDCRREVMRLEVIDTGIGIAPQDQERIFLPFERAAAGRRTGDTGTGLGLTITHLLTELMGGELNVQSQAGQGSTFTARLYLREIAAPAVSASISALSLPHHRPITGYLGRRLTLLVVDDHALQRHMLAGMLMPLGFHIREAASGRECVDSVLEQMPDAVLMDVAMDDLNGWQTARAVREAGFAALPIIMVSASTFENQAEHLAAAQVQGFVDKPVIESALLDMLQRHLKIAWSTELTALPAWGTPLSASLDGHAQLPMEVTRELIRLVSLGHMQGLRSALAQALMAHPECELEGQALHTMLARFDLDGLMARLRLATTNSTVE
jgi:CheY-like chemotaxis protein